LPLQSKSGELVLSTQDNGKHYIVTAVEALAGEFWDKNDPAKWNDATFYNWGQVMGNIHRQTKSFKPSSDTITSKYI